VQQQRVVDVFIRDNGGTSRLSCWPRGRDSRLSGLEPGLTRGFAGEVLQVLVGVCDADLASIGHQWMARGTEDHAGGTSTVRLNTITATVWERGLMHVRH
jgi:hypothetical protein